MNEINVPHCPECVEPNPNPVPVPNRRGFLQLLGGAAVSATLAPRLLAEDKPVVQPKPAEALIQELFSGLTAEQKTKVALPFDHGNKMNPTRSSMVNSALNGNTIEGSYTKGQQELVERIVRAMLSGDEGYKVISRNGTWDSSKTLNACGAHIFGEPGSGKPYVFVLSGHHLTIRCDGDQNDGLMWGGPMYYGHSAVGHAETNAYNFQTRSLTTVFRSLNAEQQKKAIATKNPGDGNNTLNPRKPGETRPGISSADLNKEQMALVEQSLRDLLKPFRKEDGDEAMSIVKANGGLEKINLAFYRDEAQTEGDRWEWWRLEGPGFVWNYRVMPHVHCRVEIKKA